MGKAYKSLVTGWKKDREVLRNKNMKRLKFHEKNFNKNKGIRVGDWIKQPDGKFTRVTHIWRDESGKPFQYQTGGSKYSQYFLGSVYTNRFGTPIIGETKDVRGYVSYSGGLDSGFDTEKYSFKNLGYTRLGGVWIWRDGIVGGGQGLDFEIPFRVFEVKRK